MLTTFARATIVLCAAATVSCAQEATASPDSAAGAPVSTRFVSLDGNDWLLAIDPKNVGRQQRWYQSPRPQAKQTKVPWIIQQAFPAYHGVAWYWHTFTPPANPHHGGRYLLRFWAVDYLAEVWLNGKPVGGHEGGEGTFVLDVTDPVKPQETNLLAVRVLNPTNEPIDGIALAHVPRRCKAVPFRPGPRRCGDVCRSKRCHDLFDKHQLAVDV